MASQNHIHVEGNGNIIIQDVQGKEIQVISGQDPDLRKKLLALQLDVQDVLRAIQESQESSVALDALRAHLDDIERRRQRRSLGVGALITLIVALGLFAVYKIATIESGPFDYTVKVVGIEGDRAIEKGEVVIEVGDQVFSRRLEQDSRVRFQLDRLYLNKKAVISFRIPIQLDTLEQAQPYVADWEQDSLLLEEDVVVEMPLRLEGLDKVKGYLYDFDTEKPLIGAHVRIEGSEIATQTDSLGNFVLHIPSADQRKYQTLVFEKAGYRPERLEGFAVHTRQVIRLPLEQ